jgi:hypothetical protein
MASSEDRALLLVKICEQEGLETDQARQLLLDYWVACDATAGVEEELYKLFAKAEWTSDSDKPKPKSKLIYRAFYEGGNPMSGISWTSDKEVAERFALYLKSPRAAWLGMPAYLPVKIATARCDRFLARFNRRGEDEVIPDREHLTLMFVSEASGHILSRTV